MALTVSNQFPTGTKAPDFTLLNTVDGTHVSLSELKAQRERLFSLFVITVRLSFILMMNW